MNIKFGLYIGIIKISLRTNRTALENSDFVQNDACSLVNRENKYGSKYVIFVLIY